MATTIRCPFGLPNHHLNSNYTGFVPRVSPTSYGATAVWRGPIGTTSNISNANPWRGFCSIRGIAVSGTRGTAVKAYNEQHECQNSFAVASPNTSLAIRNNINIVMTFVCTDGTNNYYAANGSGFDTNQSTFAFAHLATTDAEVSFSAGAVMNFAGQFGSTTTYGTRGNIASAVAVSQNLTGTAQPLATYRTRWISGCAVQQNNQGLGILWALPRLGQNSVQFLNKNTGAVLLTQSIPSPESCCFDLNGNFWVISAAAVVAYTVSGTATAPVLTAGITLTGITKPLAIAANPLTAEIAVCDGSTIQQIKGFSLTGTSTWTYGRLGGNVTNPAVTYASFYWINSDYLDSITSIDRKAYGEEMTYISYGPTGDIWVGDMGNARNLHLTPARVYKEQIAYLADAQNMGMDGSDYTCFIAQNLEFKLNLAVTYQGGDQSQLTTPTWKLVNNWSAGVPFATYRALRHIQSYTSGGVTRRYGQALVLSTVNGTTVHETIELITTGGQARLTGQRLLMYPNNAKEQRLYPEGVRWWETTGTAPSLVQTAKQMPFTGFDASNNPVFGTAVALASTPVATGDAAIGSSWGGQCDTGLTTDGTLVSFHPQQVTAGYYNLGAVKSGASAWAWQSLKATVMTTQPQTATYPDTTSGTYFGGHMGTGCTVAGNLIAVTRDGQGDVLANQHWLFHSSGLLLAQFGRGGDGGADFTDQNKAPTGYANNIGMQQFFQVGPGKFGMLVVDETFFGGPHFYDITYSETVPVALLELTLSGPSSIREGTSAYFAIIGTYSNNTSAVISSGVTLATSEGTFTNNLLTIATDAVVGDGRTLTLTATVGAVVTTKLITVIDTS